MRKHFRSGVALLLSLMLVFQLCDGVIAYAAEDPTADIVLTTPEDLKDGSWFFIAQSDWTVSEKSNDKLYIPIQRTGDLEAEASVDLKLVDVTAHAGVNYTASIHGEDAAPETVGEGVALVDIIADPDEQTEIDKDELEAASQAALDQGGQIVDSEGSPVGGIKSDDSLEAEASQQAEAGETPADAAPATGNDAGETRESPEGETPAPADENGAPAESDPVTVKKTVDAAPPADEAGGADDTASLLAYPANPLRQARNEYVGTASDRQDIAGDRSWINHSAAESYSGSDAPLVTEDYPGQVFTLNFRAGEAVKYLVIEPKYSDKGEGDSTLMLMLETPSDGYFVPEKLTVTNVTITDEDEPEDVVVSIQDSTVYARDGKAKITVTRQGRANELVTVTISTQEGSGVTGENFSGVSAKLYFAMGMQQRTVEIPVNHVDAEKDFYVTITPVSDCTIGNGKTHVFIPAAGEEAVLQSERDLLGFELEDNIWGPEFSGNYLATFLGIDALDRDRFIADYSMLRVQKDKIPALAGMSLLNGWDGRKPNETTRTFFYDGVMVRWDQGSGWFSGGHSTLFLSHTWNADTQIWNATPRNQDWTIPEGVTHYTVDVDEEDFSRRDYLFFENGTEPANVEGGYKKGMNPLLLFITNYSTNHWREADVKLIQPIRRTFQFDLIPAQPVGLRGVTAAQEAGMETVKLNSSMTATNVKVLGGNSFAVTAADQKDLRFKAVEAVMEVNGQEVTQTIAEVPQGASTVCIDVTEEMVNDLSYKGFMTYAANQSVQSLIDGYPAGDGEGTHGYGKSLKGVVKIRPVFEKIPVVVDVQPGTYGAFRGLETGEQTWYYGEKLTLTTELSERGQNAGVEPTGVAVEKRWSKSGEYLAKFDDYYLDENLTASYTLDSPYLRVQPTFTAVGNTVSVTVSAADREAFDLDKGFFQNQTPVYSADKDSYTYTLADKVKISQIVTLAAVTNDPSAVPTWTTSRDGTLYSGHVFTLRAGATAEENALTLSVSRTGNAYYASSGSLFADELNLNTGAPTGVLTPAADAVVSLGGGGGFAGEDGTFSVAAVPLVPGSTLRWSVSFNSGTEIMETRLPAAGAPTAPAQAMDGSAVDAVAMDVGMKKVPTWSALNAHFTGFYVSQNGNYLIGTSILEMNGSKTLLAAEADPGVGYLDENGNQKTETVTGVDFIFRNPRTGAVRSVHPGTYDEPTGTWQLDLGEFTNEDPDDYTYGDLLYLQMTTDRPQAGVYTEEGRQTVYAPVSTGYAVIGSEEVADQSTIEMKLPYDQMIDSFVSDAGLAGDSGPSHTTASIKSLPFLGEIKTTIGIVKTVIRYKTKLTGWAATAKRGEVEMEYLLDDLNESIDDSFEDSLVGGGMNELGDDGGSASLMGLPGGFAINAYIDFKPLPLGGSRVLLGVIAAKGNTKYQRMHNPLANFDQVISGTAIQNFYEDNVDYNNMQQIGDNGATLLVDLKEHFYTDWFGHDWSKKGGISGTSKSWLGGPYFAFGLYAGLYMDFGILSKTTHNADGTSVTEEKFQMMGAGGFVGFIGVAGGVIPCAYFPIYFGIDGNVNARAFFGLGENPNLTLDAFTNGEEINGNEWTFNVDTDVTVKGMGYVGLGFPGILGVKGAVGAQIRFTNGNKLPRWFPNNPDMAYGKGMGTDLLFEGSVDLIITTLPLYTYSLPLPLEYGSVPYFREINKARKVESILTERMNAAGLSDAQKAELHEELQRLEDVLRDHNNASERPIANASAQLWEKGRKLGLITEEERQSYYSFTFEGRAGGLISHFLDESGAIEPKHDYTVPEYGGSRWVANEGASLMASFKQSASAPILEETVNQPEAQLLDLGGGKVLMAYLDVDAGRPAGHQSVLKTAVLDTASSRWSAPVTVQNDGTGDFSPNLCMAGDQVMLSWVSTAPAKAKAEADPLDTLSQLDIFSVMLDRDGNAAGEIEQLTDDGIRDYNPQGVYDPSTGNRMVMYIKTAPDTEYQAESDAEKFFDYANPYAGNKMYSVTAYMLYNSQTDAADNKGETHEPGWARTYYFENDEPENIIPQGGQTPEEAYQDYLDAWGGQRFLPSPIKDKEGNVDQEDPPIGDLTVSMGDNGVASFAYTVDMDMDGGTWDDKELFVQFYDFQTHKCYVPVRLSDDNVSQSVPQLVRSGDETRLFFLNGLDTVIYMNISEMLNAKVPAGEDDPTEVYALRSDGTFELGYRPSYHVVDTRGAASSGELGKLTGFTAYVDANDDIYVVYPATVHSTDELGRDHYAQEIFATGFIDEGRGSPPRWSKPAQLTTGGLSNCEPAVTTDSEGNLILVHNQYEMIDRSSDDAWVKDHASVVVETDASGKETEVVKSPLMEIGPTSLVMTKCAPVGSLACTQIEYSDETPEPGDEITVGVLLENTGLTSVRKGHVDVYEYVNGVKGEKIGGGAYDVEEPMEPNTAVTYDFRWQVPGDAETLTQTSLLFEVTEYDRNGKQYDTQRFTNNHFVLRTDLESNVDSIRQQGDQYEVAWSVSNHGNLAAENLYARLTLQGLYGDLEQDYGVTDPELCGETIDTLAPGETRSFQHTVSVPVSVFERCGYDGILPELAKQEDHEAVLFTGKGRFITQEAPFNVKLNDGQALSLNTGDVRDLSVTYDLNAVADEGTTMVWTVSDPSVATVKDGKLIALGSGSAILTATLTPYGTTASVPVTVTGGGNNGGSSSGGGGGAAAAPANLVVTPSTSTHGRTSSSAANARAGDKVTITVTPDEGYEVSAVTVTDANGNAVPVTKNADGTWSFTMPDSTVRVDPIFVKEGERPDSASCPRDASCPISKFSDAKPDAWYHDGVHWALDEGVMKGTGDTTFEPNGSATRAMVVTMLWRMAGEPAGSTTAPFTDVKAGSWYADAVNWAAENSVVNGISETAFSPDTPVTREQLAAILYRYAQAQGKGFTGAWAFPLDFSDAASVSQWADEAMHWMTMNGIITGMGDGTLAPQDNATRAQIATMFMRFADVMAK